jgi:hypothetical protein
MMEVIEGARQYPRRNGYFFPFAALIFCFNLVFFRFRLRSSSFIRSCFLCLAIHAS